MVINKAIVFKKPKIKQLLEQNFTCVDMHLHTKHSKDSSISVKSLLKKAAKKGIGFAITDHNEINGYLEAVELAKKMNNPPLIIPGIEVCCSNDAELLFYFYTGSDLKEFYKNHVLPYKEKKFVIKTKILMGKLLNAAKNFNCLIAAPHPFYTIKNRGLATQVKKGKLTKDVFNKIDAIEGINAALGTKKNFDSVNLAYSLKKPIIAGSDAHNLSVLGISLVAAKGRSIKSFLDLIKKKENLVVGKSLMFISKLRPGFTIVKSGILNPIKKLRETRLYSKLKSMGFIYRLRSKIHKKMQKKFKI